TQPHLPVQMFFRRLIVLRLNLLVVACCFVLSPSVRALNDDSWVGKKVMTNKGGVRIGYTDEQDRQVFVATLTDIYYTVEKEKGDYIKVRHRGVAGWFDKADAVLLENAIPYFTRRIRQNEKDAYAYAHRGSAWREKGEYDKALADYNEAIRLDPKFAE